MNTSSETKFDGGHEESFRDSIATIDESGKRAWIYPKKPSGRFYNARTLLSIIYLLVFFSLPFIKWQGSPLFLLNVLERKFILFGVHFWPSDFFIFGLGMLIFIVFIALFTVVFGRVFCGWACPQTIFMEMVFRKIEYWIEGDAQYQKQLNHQKWNKEKIFKKASKHSIFFFISFLIANTFLSYLIGVDRVYELASKPIMENFGNFASLMIFTAVFYGVFSFFREQVCLIVCPYGRMQGVLLDKNSIVVAYDYVRGEPRHKMKKSEEHGKGDCIDCSMCIKVCPTGIDIRNGTQLECTNCTACIDVCDHMMESVGLQKGLIRYDSENGIKDSVRLRFTTRMKLYSLVLILLIGVEVFLLVSRSSVETTILRASGMLYQEQADHKISNLYTIKLINKTHENLPLRLEVDNIPAEIKLIGNKLEVKAEQVLQSSFLVFVDEKQLKKRKTKLYISIYSGNEKIKTIKTNFLGPIK